MPKGLRALMKKIMPFTAGIGLEPIQMGPSNVSDLILSSRFLTFIFSEVIRKSPLSYQLDDPAKRIHLNISLNKRQHLDRIFESIFVEVFLLSYKMSMF